LIFESVCLINDNKLEGDRQEHADKVLHENFIARDDDLELVYFTGEHVTLRADIDIQPFIISAIETPIMTVVVVIQDTVHVGPIFHRSLPMSEGA
jgi:hypothetical protein